MTKAEREHCRNLVADARDMATDDTSGEFIYRVRGPPGGYENSQTPKTKLSNKNVLDNLEILYTNADGLLTKDMNFRF